MEEKKPVAKKSPAKKAAPKPKAQEPKVEKKQDTVAVFSEGKLFHPVLGRLDRGYNILSSEAAKEWMQISPKVREASPQEVASAYGV